MPVKIHGKDYKTVSERIAEFRGEHGSDYGIVTNVKIDGDLAIATTSIIRYRYSKGDLIESESAALQLSPVPSVYQSQEIVATGTAVEEKDSSNINRTSHVENAETSAVGRALAFLGYAGSEIASADEVAEALKIQASKDAEKSAALHMQAVREHFSTIEAIQNGIAMEDYATAAEAWFELSADEKKSLWVAPSKGGIFTTEERKVMQSKEFRESHYGAESTEEV